MGKYIIKNLFQKHGIKWKENKKLGFAKRGGLYE